MAAFLLKVRQLLDSRWGTPLAILWFILAMTWDFIPQPDGYNNWRTWLPPLGALTGAAPLLYLAFTKYSFLDNLKPARRYFIWQVYWANLGWNVATTWWIWNSTAAGAMAAFVFNALFQLFPWWVMRRVQARSGPAWALTAWVLAQLAFEMFHMQWDLSWSWLNLGNALATHHVYAQWYSLTGALGGSLWLWACQALLAYLIFKSDSSKAITKLALPTIFVPILLSLFMFWGGQQTNTNLPLVEVAVLQPNIDPYTEKYVGGFEGARAQLEKMLATSDQLVSDSTKYLLWPETAIPYPLMIDERHIDQSEITGRLQSWIRKHPHLQLISGINTYQFKAETLAGQPNAPEEPDQFNTALYINGQSNGQPGYGLYHKSKLVPGVEQLPYPELLNFLGGLAIDLGGTVGSLGKQADRAVFGNDLQAGKIAPVICYESIYGGFNTGFIRNGANLIGIITNDAWWGDTWGYRQHWAFARLRAIETNRMVARSANTGISGFIDEQGNTVLASPYNQPAGLKQKVRLHPDTDQTFYVQFGDWIAYFAIFGLASIVVLSFLRKI